MTYNTRIATSLMAAALFTGASSLYAQSSPTGNQKQNQTAVGPQVTTEWNTPPAGTEQAQLGFRDGIQAMQLDKLAGRPIDPKVSHLYKNPPVKKDAKDAYRTAFENGYKAALQNSGGGM